MCAEKLVMTDESDYALLGHIQQTFDAQVARPAARLFTTAGDETLYDAFLDQLPWTLRNRYACRCCRHFVNRFGGLVTLDEHGQTVPVLWQPIADSIFQPAIAKLHQIVKSRPVTGVFLSAERTLGQPTTGNWSHMAVKLPDHLIYRGQVKTAGQAMAEKREDYRAMKTALGELPLRAVKIALPMLETDELYQSERVVGVARWLHDLHEQLAGAQGRVKDNLLWQAVASAPTGFCHPRSSMIGSLLEDIIAGKPLEAVKRRFAEKMHPLQYLRPQAPPSAGNIAQAEKIIEKLQAAGSLDRRYARVEEIQALWRPADRQPPVQAASIMDTGVFADLKPKNAAPRHQQVRGETAAITCAKFVREVLPRTAKITVWTPSRGNFIALVTAARPDAPPILQWDRADQRNPVSWYVYPGGSPADNWGLKENAWTEATAVTYQPSMWQDGFDHQGKSLIFILAGAMDKRTSGLALFPALLKADLHAIRSTIEAYSQQGTPSGKTTGSACGLRIDDRVAGFEPCRVQVTDHDGNVLSYLLDRWD